MSLSLCMIVKNEEDNLPRCLLSIKDLVDEMIIVDTGSSDSTVEIAKSFGAKVYYFPWNNSFSDARNHSLKHASGDWILIMDADDELEEEGNQAILNLIKDSDADAYYLKTMNYTGEEPGTDLTMNMSLRLIKNGRGYFYSNPVHEQIHSNIVSINPQAKILSEDIKVYHYGYLKKNIIAQNKRSRNISLLEKELEMNPGYNFALFNLGSEYYAMGENEKAIHYFEDSYKNFDPKDGFSSHLVIKMVNCYTNLGKFDEGLKLCEDGLKFYPEFTELVYMKGIIHHAIGKPVSALKYFKKCTQMGEAPSHFNVIIGVGTFRAFFMLGEIYYDFEDYASAAENFESTLRFNPDFMPALHKLVRCWCKLNLEQRTLEERIEDLRKYKVEKIDFYVFEILNQERYFELSEKLIERCIKTSGKSGYLKFNKGLCKLYLKKYNSVLHIMGGFKKDPEYQTRAMCAQALCKILQEDYLGAAKCLSSKDINTNDALVKVYLEFLRIMETGNCIVLSEEEVLSSMYSIAILDLLKILMILHEFEIFEKALQLLNAINDKTVLLKLAKLYYTEGCYGLAYKELIRSIKLFEVIDREGAGILQKLKLKGF
ncbi:MAG: glycosyltransferase [Clostridia bacterium]|nr:glycosyltransferase [Clostridia bacterium]